MYYIMFPFDTSPICNVPASYDAFEYGGHVKWAVQPAGMLQQATEVAQARSCTSILGENMRRGGVCIG